MGNLVRAMVYNPEVLIAVRPTDECDADGAALILGLLREYVDNRGVEFTPAEFAVQRPHTVFITSSEDREGAEAAGDVADQIWRISASGLSVEKHTPIAASRAWLKVGEGDAPGSIIR